MTNSRPTGAPAWFDAQYWRALVFKELDEPGPVEHKRTSVQAVSAVRAVDFYIRTSVTTGPPLDPSIVTRWRRAIPELMRQFIGQPWSGTITEGTVTVERPGVVSIEIHNDRGCASGGFSSSGGRFQRGIIRLNTSQGDWCLATVILAHELGHVLGFSHVGACAGRC